MLPLFPSSVLSVFASLLSVFPVSTFIQLPLSSLWVPTLISLLEAPLPLVPLLSSQWSAGLPNIWPVQQVLCSPVNLFLLPLFFGPLPYLLLSYWSAYFPGGRYFLSPSCLDFCPVTLPLELTQLTALTLTLYFFPPNPTLYYYLPFLTLIA